MIQILDNNLDFNFYLKYINNSDLFKLFLIQVEFKMLCYLVDFMIKYMNHNLKELLIILKIKKLLSTRSHQNYNKDY